MKCSCGGELFYIKEVGTIWYPIDKNGYLKAPIEQEAPQPKVKCKECGTEYPATLTYNDYVRAWDKDGRRMDPIAQEYTKGRG